LPPTPPPIWCTCSRSTTRLEEIEGVEVTGSVLDSIDSEGSHPIPVIYQSGYLTVKDYDPRFKLYTLDYPNQEVAEGFLNYLMPFYTDSSEDRCIEKWIVEE